MDPIMDDVNEEEEEGEDVVVHVLGASASEGDIIAVEEDEIEVDVDVVHRDGPSGSDSEEEGEQEYEEDEEEEEEYEEESSSSEEERIRVHQIHTAYADSFNHRSAYRASSSALIHEATAQIMSHSLVLPSNSEILLERREQEQEETEPKLTHLYLIAETGEATKGSELWGAAVFLFANDTDSESKSGFSCPIVNDFSPDFRDCFTESDFNQRLESSGGTGGICGGSGCMCVHAAYLSVAGVGRQCIVEIPRDLPRITYVWARFFSKPRVASVGTATATGATAETEEEKVTDNMMSTVVPPPEAVSIHVGMSIRKRLDASKHVTFSSFAKVSVKRFGLVGMRTAEFAQCPVRFPLVLAMNRLERCRFGLRNVVEPREFHRSLLTRSTGYYETEFPEVLQPRRAGGPILQPDFVCLCLISTSRVPVPKTFDVDVVVGAEGVVEKQQKRPDYHWRFLSAIMDQHLEDDVLFVCNRRHVTEWASDVAPLACEWIEDVGTIKTRVLGGPGFVQVFDIVIKQRKSLLIMHDTKARSQGGDPLKFYCVFPPVMYSDSETVKGIMNFVPDCMQSHRKNAEETLPHQFASLAEATERETELRLALSRPEGPASAGIGTDRAEMARIDRLILTEMPLRMGHLHYCGVFLSFLYALWHTVRRRWYLVGIATLFLPLSTYTAVAAVYGYLLVDLIVSWIIANRGFVSLLRCQPPSDSVFEYVIRFESWAETACFKWFKIGLTVVLMLAAFVGHILLMLERTGDVECVQADVDSHAEGNGTVVTTGLFLAIQHFYADHIFSNSITFRDYCRFADTEFFDFYASMVFGVISAFVTLFEVATYDGASCPAHLKNYDLLKKRGVAFPPISVTFGNFLTKDPSMILQDVLNGLSWMRTRGALATNDRHLLGDELSHVDFSYFDHCSSADLGFLQYFFIDEMARDLRRKEKREEFEVERTAPDAEETELWMQYLLRESKFKWTGASSVATLCGASFFLVVLALCFVFEMVLLVFWFFLSDYDQSVGDSAFLLFRWTTGGFVARAGLYAGLLGLTIVMTFLIACGTSLFGDVFEGITEYVDSTHLNVEFLRPKKRCCDCLCRYQRQPPYRGFLLCLDNLCSARCRRRGGQCCFLSLLWILVLLVCVVYFILVIFVVLPVYVLSLPWLLVLPCLYLICSGVALCHDKCSEETCDVCLCRNGHTVICDGFVSAFCCLPLASLVLLRRVVGVCVKNFEDPKRRTAFINDQQLESFVHRTWYEFKRRRDGMQAELRDDLLRLIVPVLSQKVVSIKSVGGADSEASSAVKTPMSDEVLTTLLRNIHSHNFLVNLFLRASHLYADKRLAGGYEEYVEMVREFQFSFGMWVCKIMLSGSGKIPTLLKRHLHVQAIGEDIELVEDLDHLPGFHSAPDL